jgi:colanic acid biosynthesis glycosyl transferase WcaI
VLLYGSNYYPEPIGIPRYTTEMAEDMASRGNLVTVICAAPLYPDWKKRSEYKYSQYSSELKELVKIIRVPTYVPRNTGFGQRVIYELFFLFFSLPVVLLQIFKGIDNFIITTPPIALCALLFFVPKKIHKTVIVKDMQVDIANTLGIIKNRKLLNFLFWAEKKMLLRADCITAVSENMLSALRKKGIACKKSSYFPDWVNSDRLHAASFSQTGEMRRRLKLPEGSLIVGYSGNLARKQGVDLILDIAVEFQKRNRSDVHFLVCGDGPTKEKLVSDAKKMDLVNITFVPLVSEYDLPILLSSIDIHFVPQRDEVSDLVMPGKIFNIMACSRPIVITAPKNSSIDNVINKSCAGLRFDREDFQGILAGIDSLLENRALRESMGNSGREYIISELSMGEVLENFYSDISLSLPINSINY